MYISRYVFLSACVLFAPSSFSTLQMPPLITEEINEAESIAKEYNTECLKLLQIIPHKLPNTSLMLVTKYLTLKDICTLILTNKDSSAKSLELSQIVHNMRSHTLSKMIAKTLLAHNKSDDWQSIVAITDVNMRDTEIYNRANYLAQHDAWRRNILGLPKPINKTDSVVNYFLYTQLYPDLLQHQKQSLQNKPQDINPYFVIYNPILHDITDGKCNGGYIVSSMQGYKENLDLYNTDSITLKLCQKDHTSIKDIKTIDQDMVCDVDTTQIDQTSTLFHSMHNATTTRITVILPLKFQFNIIACMILGDTYKKLRS